MRIFDVIRLVPTLELDELLTEEEKKPIEVFVKKTTDGWEGWPADWTPEERRCTPEIEYPRGLWVQLPF